MSTNQLRNLISDSKDLKPHTRWSETVWAFQGEESYINHHTKARLCVAALLPFKNQKIDWDGFRKSISWMQQCAAHYAVEIVFVLNADTGYLFNLSLQEYREVLQKFREFFPEQKFIAGVTAFDAHSEHFLAERYFPMIDAVQEHQNAEVMIMTSRTLNQLEPEARRDAYYEIAEHLTLPGIVHALEPAFVPWATPYEPWLLHQLAMHPKFIGGKVSTLDAPHYLYWSAMCKSLGLDFVPHSGDDYGIATAIKLGLPLLIGAGVSACPLICAAKDLWLDDQAPGKKYKLGIDGFDTQVYKLFEAIQSLEDQVFRLDETMSASAYKHSTAHVLFQMGLIATPETHPQCQDLRGSDEAVRMAEALRRPRRIARQLGIPHFFV